MSTTSDVCFPLEILYEFILRSSSSPSILAAWCSVSQSLLAFAGPLLYETVSLRRSEDVIPFLKRLRLARSSSPPPSSSLLLLPFVKGIQRLEIFAVPRPADLDRLFQTVSPGQESTKLVLSIDWSAKRDANDLSASSFFVPRLLLEVVPTSFEWIGRNEIMALSLALLRPYLAYLFSHPLLSYNYSHQTNWVRTTWDSLQKITERYREYDGFVRREAIERLRDLWEVSKGVGSHHVVLLSTTVEKLSSQLRLIDSYDPFRTPSSRVWESLEEMFAAFGNVLGMIQSLRIAATEWWTFHFAQIEERAGRVSSLTAMKDGEERVLKDPEYPQRLRQREASEESFHLEYPDLV